MSYFPLDLAEGTILATPGPYPPGGVVPALESLGTASCGPPTRPAPGLATEDELRAFGVDPDLAPLESRVVIEIIHATYGIRDEPLEVVVSVRPADSNVIVFETYEGPVEETEQQQTTAQSAAPLRHPRL